LVGEAAHGEVGGGWRHGESESGRTKKRVWLDRS
jgi:hypothetical protein